MSKKGCFSLGKQPFVLIWYEENNFSLKTKNSRKVMVIHNYNM